ncbi:MAG: PAS domain-containing protein [Williamsia sp.]|nr:PAS domain-containing protein [Williamsia sp.]
MKAEVEEASTTSNNLQNLVNSTAIATVFLDKSFHVVLFTPTASELFNLITTDYGRPFSDITSQLKEEDVLKDAELVLQHLNPVERDVQTLDGRTFTMRVTSYCTTDHRINGVVFTFLNITEHWKAEAALRKSEESLRIALEAGEMATWDWNILEDRVSWNEQYDHLLGIPHHPGEQLRADF